ACMAERALLRSLGGGCQLPIAGHAQLHDEELFLDGLVADPQGRAIVRGQQSALSVNAERLGAELAERLLQQGADKLLGYR
ncbi:MAG: hydroxymethylbilane synthase, partial [Acidobacteriota bacterium]